MKDDERKIRIAAHCVFDGWLFSKPEQYKYYFGYSNKNRVLLNQFKEDVKMVYNKIAKERCNSKGVPMIEFGSKIIFKEITQLIEELNNLKSNKLQRIYLRAFFDDEGRVVFAPEKSTRRVCGTSIDKNIRNKVLTYLKNFEIIGAEYGNDVVIQGKKNISYFKERIGFTNGVKVVRLYSWTRWFGKDKNKLVSNMLSSYIRNPVT